MDKIACASMALCLCSVLASAQRDLESAPIGYFIADGAGTPGFRAGDRQLATWALDEWRRAASPGLRFEVASEADARVRLYWTEPNSGRYGEMQPLFLRGRPGAAVYIQADVGLLGGDIAARAARDGLFRDSVVYLTCLHELGHALGLEHTADIRDIMYFFGFGGDIVEYFSRYRRQLHSRADIAAASGMSEVDRRRIVGLYTRRSPQP